MVCAFKFKVGDTCVDIEEGKNAGVWTAAVLTGIYISSLLYVLYMRYLVGSAYKALHIYTYM